MALTCSLVTFSSMKGLTELLELHATCKLISKHRKLLPANIVGAKRQHFRDL